MTIIGGSDQYLGTLTHIANTMTTSFKAVAQVEGLEGATNALSIPGSFHADRKNDNGSSRLFDIENFEGTAADNW